MPRVVPPRVRKRYASLRDEGYPRKEAAAKAGVSERWAYSFDRGLVYAKGSSGGNPTIAKHAGSEVYAKVRGATPEFPDPKPRDELGPEALRALDDIAYFGRRYFGVQVQPFQVYSTARIMELAGSDREEYVVINQAPGTGKSTFHMLILPSWVTCRERRDAGLLGSATDTQAKWYVGNLKDALSMTVPITASPDEKRLGIAVDAEATLVEDFGRFKPEVPEKPWANDRFFVELLDGQTTNKKEPTWSAFGLTSRFLGLRVKWNFWDDVYDPVSNRTAEARDALKTRWSDVCEKRLDPGGLLILQMQRLDADDICHYALEMGGTVIREGDETPRKYHHIKFKAHYPELCHGDHGPDAKPYEPAAPETGGCLLYPKRLPYEKVLEESQNNPNFEMVYQQEDIATKRSLVDRLWIYGGTDPDTRQMHPGCIDRDRDLCEVPDLAGEVLSVVTADPSPTNFWAVIWWIVRIDLARAEPVERYVMDIRRAKMEAPDFLDWHQEKSRFTGLMEDWQVRSKALGHPITYWIVEDNAAQRFMLQYSHAQRWQRAHSATIVGHNTNRSNKADKDLGVWSIRNHYRYGRVRIPYRHDSDARPVAQKLIDEVCRYPDARTDDCVMSHWFLEWWLPTLVSDVLSESLEPDEGSWRPSWMSPDAA